MIRRSPTLADHAQAVSSYLKDFSSYPKSRREYSDRFFEYLLSVCWPKLRRRITSWHGLGFISILGNTDIPAMKIADFKHWSIFQKAGRKGDTSLANFLVKNYKHIRLISSKYSKDALDLENLMGAVRTFLEDPSSPTFYNKDTAFEFHRLVYTGFLAFSVLLEIVKHFVKLNKREPSREIRSAFVLLTCITRLLLHILSSTAFKNHITVWTNHGRNMALVTPQYCLSQLYRTSWNRLMNSIFTANGIKVDEDSSQADEGDNKTDEDDSLEVYSTLP